jgi:acyl-coenzyme A synthetase/AMP-(fatty) acid ligase
MVRSLALLFSSEREADRPVAVQDGETITLRRFRNDVAAATACLQPAGYRRAAVACRSAYWTAVGWLALAHTGGEMVLAPNSLPATLAALRDAYDVILSDGALPPGEEVLTLQAGMSSASPLPAIDADHAIVSLFTSGSTGQAKRVAKTMRQLDLEVAALAQILDAVVPPGARVQATVTHQHLYGLTFRLCWPLATGRVVIGASHEFWEPLMSALTAGDVVVTSPAHLSRMDGLAALPPDRRPSAVVSAGAPLAPAAAESSRALLGQLVHEFFGSTETGLIGHRLRDGDGRPWRPLPGVSVDRLADGRLHVRAPHLAMPAGQTTEDLIELQADGFEVRGRADRIAKIEGVRVSLAEFETTLAGLTGVGQAVMVVLGGTSPLLGAVVVLDRAGRQELDTAGAFRLSRRLRRDLARTLPVTALPRRWRFVRQLPTGPIGKASAADLAALFKANYAAPEDV